jgi:hypothetical protein
MRPDDDVHMGDDADKAASKIPEDLEKAGWYVKKDVRNGKDKDNKHPHYVQKYTEPGLLAEAVIVGGIPYFAVTRARAAAIPENVIAVTLERSIPIDDDNEYLPFEPSAYLSEPYRFKSKQEFNLAVGRAMQETRDSMYRKVKAV